MSAREHKIDPATLNDGTVVVAVNVDGDELLLVADRGGYVRHPYMVGMGAAAFSWGEWSIERVLVPREEWEPLPDGPTSEHKGRMVRQVIDDVEARGILGAVKGGMAFTPSDAAIGETDFGEWSVLVEPKPSDPDAALVERVATEVAAAMSIEDEVDPKQVARDIIATVREAGEQA